jgi:hypothetical protein
MVAFDLDGVELVFFDFDIFALGKLVAARLLVALDERRRSPRRSSAAAGDCRFPG